MVMYFVHKIYAIHNQSIRRLSYLCVRKCQVRETTQFMKIYFYLDAKNPQLKAIL